MNKTINNQDDSDKINEEELVEAVDEQGIEKEPLESEDKARDLENKYIRVLADYQNLEKRMREERIQLFQSANKDLLLKFLPILDTLVLAQQHEENKTLSIVVAQFLNIAKAEGMIAIKVLGEQFDPTIMEVIATQEGKEGIVIQEVRTGYLLHDKLLRVAGVIVGNGQKKEGK